MAQQALACLRECAADAAAYRASEGSEPPLYVAVGKGARDTQEDPVSAAPRWHRGEGTTSFPVVMGDADAIGVYNASFTALATVREPCPLRALPAHAPAHVATRAALSCPCLQRAAACVSAALAQPLLCFAVLRS